MPMPFHLPFLLPRLPIPLPLLFQCPTYFCTVPISSPNGLFCVFCLLFYGLFSLFVYFSVLLLLFINLFYIRFNDSFKFLIARVHQLQFLLDIFSKLNDEFFSDVVHEVKLKRNICHVSVYIVLKILQLTKSQ